MGQISIPMLNKVGYSMYWNSMWDNKVDFSRALKEDIYLNKFVPLIFNDSISSKILKYSKKNVKDLNTDYYNIQIKTKTKHQIFLFLLKNSKLNFYCSKLWILKYQNWIIIYFFMYLPKYNRLKKRFFFSKKIEKYDNNVFNSFVVYKKANVMLNLSYNFYKNQVFKNYF